MDSNDDLLDGLEERLQAHEKAFESLLALTPAREYFGKQIVDGQDPSEQWNRKKQTKEEKRAAKKAKLDPANQKSALDVIKERERKRKRELGVEDGEADATQVHGESEETNKRQKLDTDDAAAEARRRAKAEKRKEKRQVKHEKLARKKAKSEAKKAARQAEAVDETHVSRRQTRTDAEDEMEMAGDAEQPQVTGDIETFDASGLAEPDLADVIDVPMAQAASEASSAPSSPVVDSPAFDLATNHSTASSSSSIVPPTESEQLKEPRRPQDNNPGPGPLAAEPAQKALVQAKTLDPPSGISSPKLVLPNIDQAQLQERLRQRIEELRARRKADGPDGKPAKSRQELLDQRRKKEEQRKATKKEQRRKAKEEEQRKQEAQLRGSGSPLSGDIFASAAAARSPQHETNFSFSRLAFDDGSTANPSLTSLHDPRKAKGRSDPKTALEAVQKKQSRLAGLDPTKRADIAEKDLWLNATKRAHGERVRDDTSLLKKALKRQEKGKAKSEREWREREEAVVKGKEAKQRKRERNLEKRREEKGGKGKKQGPAKKQKKKGVGRPGFEGRFKA